VFFSSAGCRRGPERTRRTERCASGVFLFSVFLGNKFDLFPHFSHIFSPHRTTDLGSDISKKETSKKDVRSQIVGRAAAGGFGLASIARQLKSEIPSRGQFCAVFCRHFRRDVGCPIPARNLGKNTFVAEIGASTHQSSALIP